ncbi:MAG: hypothetical protein RIC35_00970 [Marinoscillum sp.]
MSLANECYGQQYHVDVGIRCQKTIGLYFENGIASQWSLDQLANQRLYLGLGFVSSRLGSALGTNAIKQDNYQIWLAYYFRKDKKLRSFASLNSGYFIANYEEEIFDVLDNSSMLLSGSSGVEYTLPLKLKLNAAIGYNLISGNGEEGPGTLYPLFAQFTVYYPLR